MNDGYFADVARCFRGPAVWVNWVALFYALLAGFFVVYLTIGLFDATTTRGQILHATGVIVSALGIVLTKIWFWTQMTRRWLSERLDQRT